MQIEVLKAEGLIEKGSFNFEALNDKLVKNQPIDFLIEMSLEEQILLFKLLFENKKYDIIAKLVEHKSSSLLEITPTIKLLLVQTLNESSELNYKDLKKIIDKLKPSTTLFLWPYKKSLTSEEVKKLEQSILTLKSKLQKFKTELLDQVQFLKNQQLLDKEIEIRQRLEFHFPEEIKKTGNKPTKPKKLEHSKDLSFSKLIERNLSFESRKKKRLSKDRKLVLKEKEDHDENFLLQMIETWLDIFQDNSSLLLNQIYFLDVSLVKVFEKILNTRNDIDDWTKVNLYLKSERFYEGLSYLESIEKKVLDNNPGDVYHYYYYKALFYYNTGMTEEAEKLFKIIHEQKENFRDVKFYLSN